jgi:hypothetical protein
MLLSEVLERCWVGDSFYQETKPGILYERIGSLIERNELGWAIVNRLGEWEFMNEVDWTPTDWILVKNPDQEEYNPKARPPKLKRNLFIEKNRLGWTFYD